MAQLTITIPDAQVDRVLAAFAPRAGVEDPANMTAEDARGVLIDLIKKIVRQHERQEAEEAIVITDVEAT